MFRINNKWESDDLLLHNCVVVIDVAARLPSHILCEKCLSSRRWQLSEHAVLGGGGRLDTKAATWWWKVWDLGRDGIST